MKFARLFLVGIVLTVIGVDAWLITRAIPDNRFAAANLLWVLTGPLVVTALAALVFSYTKVDRQNGQLVLDRNSLYMKLVSNYWSDPKKPWPGEQVSICSLFWASVIPVGFVMLLGWFVLAGIPYVIAHIAMAPPTFSNISAPSAETWTVIGLPLGGMIFMILMIAVSVGTSRIKSGTLDLIATTAAFLVGIAGAVSAIAMSVIVDHSKVTIREAAHIYWEGCKEYGLWVLLWIGIGIAAIAAAIGVIALLVVSVQALRKTIVGEMTIGMWKAFKEKACPIVKISGEIPVVVEEKPAESTEPPPEPVEPAKS